MASSPGYLHEDFLLTTEWARLLYHEHASRQPICDFHCHLPSGEIADDRRFSNLTEIWLAGDHYKWRAMRGNGVPEELITGRETSDYDKFLAYARTMPFLVRNPLHHWSHLELRRCFGIEMEINEANAPRIWAEANERLADPSLSVRGLLRRFGVKVVCTTDDPTDDLSAHRRLAGSVAELRVVPTFRPDRALTVDRADEFRPWVERLSRCAGKQIRDFSDFRAAIADRHEAFHATGGRLSDHGMEFLSADSCTADRAADIFSRAIDGTAISAGESAQFSAFMMDWLARLDSRRGWTKQLHLGALRNTNTRLRRLLGADAGVDSIGDFPQAVGLARFLDRLDRDDELPRMILYNLNPADNYVFASMIGNFQDGRIAGKLQYGSAWWFLDQIDGMTWQIDALSQLGLLSRFVGMVTDSRSFLSYVRHEYFRRLLCGILGREVEAGLIPADRQLLGSMVEAICFHNAASQLGLEH